MVKKVCQLRFDKENNRIMFDGVRLHWGDYFEVLIFDGLSNSEKWIKTRLLINRYMEWFLCGLYGYDIDGLFARM